MSSPDAVPMTRVADPERQAATRRVTLVGAGVNLILAAGKILIGIIGQSQALVADGIHSLSDLASDAVVLVASHHGSQDADEKHPYGHGRIETAATVVVGAFLLLAAGGILWDATRRLLAPETLLHPGWLALIAAFVSILANEGLYQYTIVVARRVRSNLLRANAWHHRSDALSSVVVLVGVIGVIGGVPWLDAAAAIAVALMIARMGGAMAWRSVRELVDTGLDPEEVERIRREILTVDGVQTLHMLRSRRMGPDAYIDVHILVDPRLSVSEGHQIGETVRAHLIRQLEDVSDVTVHIDPEDDEKMAPCAHLPLRGELLDRLDERFSNIEAATRIEDITLHYLDGRVHVDLVLPMEAAGEDTEKLATSFQEAVEGLDEIGEVRVHFR